MMRELISEMSIYDGNTCIFSDKTSKYIIPLYQRAFAWTENEIVQLINDIEDFNDDLYFLGSLEVDYEQEHENNNEILDTLISNMNLSQGQLDTLNCYMAGMTLMR